MLKIFVINGHNITNFTYTLSFTRYTLHFSQILVILNTSRTNRQIETKFCIHIIIDNINVWDCKAVIFLQICNRVTTLDWCQNLVFAPYLENEKTD